jgi:hypothetical protein
MSEFFLPVDRSDWCWTLPYVKKYAGVTCTDCQNFATCVRYEGPKCWLCYQMAILGKLQSGHPRSAGHFCRCATCMNRFPEVDAIAVRLGAPQHREPPPPPQGPPQGPPLSAPSQPGPPPPPPPRVAYAAMPAQSSSSSCAATAAGLVPEAYLLQGNLLAALPQACSLVLWVNSQRWECSSVASVRA